MGRTVPAPRLALEEADAITEVRHRPADLADVRADRLSGRRTLVAWPGSAENYSAAGHARAFRSASMARRTYRSIRSSPACVTRLVTDTPSSREMWTSPKRST